MNKKLVALAVAGVLALPVTAQAQTANVTLYGRLNIDVELVKGKQSDGSNPTVYRVSTNSSRFGIRGTESLGGGLNAIFQIENSVVPDASGGTIAGRETFVGLQGGWGTFKVGRFLAPYDDMHPIFGNVPTLTTTILSTASLWAQGALGQPDNGGFDDRIKNSVRYDTPVVAGFQGSFQYGGYEDAPTKQAHAGVISLNGIYNNGPIQAGVGYENHKDVRAVGLTDWAFTLTGGYNFGVARVAAVYERLDYDTPSGSLKRDLWGASVTVPAGPGTVFASWQRAMEVKGSAALNTRVGNLVKGPDSEADHFTLSYTYPLSKRTITYAGVSYIRNAERGVQTFNINGYSVGSGGDPFGVLAGICHMF
jgi:predicted porin